MISDWRNGESERNDAMRNVFGFQDSSSLLRSQDSTESERKSPSDCIYDASSANELWILGLSDSSTGMMSWRMRLRSYDLSELVLSSRYSTLFSRAYARISDLGVVSSGRKMVPEMTLIPESHLTLAHFTIFPMIVSV
jgi:hypothetical protein